MVPEDQDQRRAVSPPGTRSVMRPINGIVQQTSVASNATRHGPTSSSASRSARRGDEDSEGVMTADESASDSYGPGGQQGNSRERPISPENMHTATARTRSPTVTGGMGGGPGNGYARAMSPQQQMAIGDPSLVGMMNGSAGASVPMKARSPSPGVERPSGLSYYENSGDPSSGTPSQQQQYNDVPSTSAGSRSNTPQNNVRMAEMSGSKMHTTSVELARELKSREAEVDALKKREEWMKAALARATQAGFVYNVADMDEAKEMGLDDASISSSLAADKDGSELVMKFKQFKAQMQVRSFFHAFYAVLRNLSRFFFFLTSPSCWSMPAMRRSDYKKRIA
jgi:hypothetical protein